jgi:ribonuclease BN (tRNA processing enzyme)
VSHLDVRFLGTGDAFGDGGRFQACILVSARDLRLLIDCGATSPLAMKRASIDPNDMDAVIVSHFHGDHFGGIPYLILDGQFRRRTRPLTIAGPTGIAERVRAQMEAAFPGSSATTQRFPIVFSEIAGTATHIAGAEVYGVPVDHTPGASAIGLRMRVEGRTIAYSGDTAWTGSLPSLADRADLFICEAYSFDKPIPFHLSYSDVRTHREAIGAKRLYLTHVGPEMLARRREVREAVADDGTVIEL